MQLERAMGFYRGNAGAFTLPATMPLNARRNAAANSCAGWSVDKFSPAMFSCVGAKGSWNGRSINKRQL